MRRSWIKIETNTPDKPEICVIASQLRLDADAVMGKLVRLWAWAELNVSDRNEVSVTMEFLDKVAGKKGFSAALEKAGWLQRKGDGLVFPNFERHNGRAAKGRAQTAMRVSRHRKRKNEAVAEEVNEALEKPSLEAKNEPVESSNVESDISVVNHDNLLIQSDKGQSVEEAQSAEIETLIVQVSNAEESELESVESVTMETKLNTRARAEVSAAEAAERKLSRAEKKDQIAGQPQLF